MSEQIERSIVRIWDARTGRTAGMGFLVHANQVLTCARVVARALGLPEVPVEMPRTGVHLDFLAAPGYALTASPFLWRPRRADDKSRESDIAGLALEGKLPGEAQATPVLVASKPSGHDFDACGCPDGKPDAVWVSGVLLGETAGKLIQMGGVTQPGPSVPQGFCGTPVWDRQLNGVVGMMVAVDRPSQIEAFLMIPGHVLCTLWPELSDACRQRHPPTHDWQIFFGMPWSYFANLADAVIILDPASQRVIVPLEENLSTILDLIDREPGIEDWAPLLESLSNFSDYSSPPRANESSVKALCQVTKELGSKLVTSLSPSILPPSVEKSLGVLLEKLGNACQGREVI
jgi:hypothetical protein